MTPLSIEVFGKILLESGDLDPAYIAIHKAKLDERTLHRLVLAYWCFYSLGTAAKIAEAKTDKQYWFLMGTAALNEGLRTDGFKPWPRGAERRHFRGAQAVTPMSELITRYKTATDAVAGFLNLGRDFAPMTYTSVSKAAMNHRGFGPWIAFKIADMAERVLGYPVDFGNCHLGIYKDPRQGAAVAYWEHLHSIGERYDGHDYGKFPWNYPITDSQLQDMVTQYVFRFRKFKAPPTGDRKVNVQEVETIFCKYKSHLKGHYPVGKDSREIKEGLHGWGDLAEHLRAGVPEHNWARMVVEERA